MIWHTPLEYYLNYNVAEIRQLQTHGEKRVRVVLEVFYILHEALSQSMPSEHLFVRLVPKFIEPLERWIQSVMSRGEVPSPNEVRECFTLPLLKQVQVDAGDVILQLAQARLGINGPTESVRHRAKQMGVTRARVYQLLEDCSKIMNVRWPEGHYPIGRAGQQAQVDREAAGRFEVVPHDAQLVLPGHSIGAGGR